MKRTPNNTTVLNLQKKETKWHLIDAKDQILGKVAVKITNILIGKDKAEYLPNQNWGDKVVVINAEQIDVTGKKMTDKIYYHNTLFPKGLRSENLQTMLKRKPEDVIKKAIYGMLPKNKLRKERMANLYIYIGDKHPHQAQLVK
jgi:large subunit ribosomal protein L13